MRLIDTDKLKEKLIRCGLNRFAYDIVDREISYIGAVQAIPLDKVKQAREEMESRLYNGIPQTTGFTWQNLGINMCLEILDKLIAESEVE